MPTTISRTFTRGGRCESGLCTTPFCSSLSPLLPVIHPCAESSRSLERSHPWQAFPFFLQNLTLAGPPFDTVRVTWSLAIEEQFYLVWPVIVVGSHHALRMFSLKPLALSGFFLSMALQGMVGAHRAHPHL